MEQQKTNISCLTPILNIVMSVDFSDTRSELFTLGALVD